MQEGAPSESKRNKLRELCPDHGVDTMKELLAVSQLLKVEHKITTSQKISPSLIALEYLYRGESDLSRTAHSNGNIYYRYIFTGA